MPFAVFIGAMQNVAISKAPQRIGKMGHLLSELRSSNESMRIGCDFIADVLKSVAFCAAKVALLVAAFAERKATLIKSQPSSEFSFPLALDCDPCAA